MKPFNLKKYASEKPTDQMIEWFEKRTKNHIDLVGKYCKMVADKFSEFTELIDRSEVHDQSKYEEPEYTPYLWVTWKHKCKDDGKEFNPPDGVLDKMNEATHHHITFNSHHPEYHSSKKIELGSNDKPKGIVDATSMPGLDIAEMVCDWAGMSEEKRNSLKEWADTNINVRWKFSDEQVNLIYKLIDFIEENK